MPCSLFSILKVHPGLTEGWGTGCLDLRTVSAWELSSGERTVGTSETAQVGSSGGCFRIPQRSEAWSPKRWGAVGCIRKEVLFGGVPE